MLIHICAYPVCNQLDFNLADCVYRILILHNEIGMPELVLGTMERLHWILFPCNVVLWIKEWNAVIKCSDQSFHCMPRLMWWFRQIDVHGKLLNECSVISLPVENANYRITCTQYTQRNEDISTGLLRRVSHNVNYIPSHHLGSENNSWLPDGSTIFGQEASRSLTSNSCLEYDQNPPIQISLSW